jgi:hypothetical protein
MAIPSFLLHKLMFFRYRDGNENRSHVGSFGEKCNTMQLSYSYSFGLTREQKIIDVKYVGRKNWTQQKRFRPP